MITEVGVKKEVVFFSFFLRRAAKGARDGRNILASLGRCYAWYDEIISGGPSLPGARTPHAWVSGALTVILDFGSTHLWYVTSGRRMRARA
jgi:hypothetical protein